MKTAADAANKARHHSTSLGKVIRVRDLAIPVKFTLRRPGRGSQVGGAHEKGRMEAEQDDARANGWLAPELRPVFGNHAGMIIQRGVLGGVFS